MLGLVLLLLMGAGISCIAYKPVQTRYEMPALYLFPPVPDEQDKIVTLEAAELGRFLFYDPVLSADSTVSCASCHRQEVAFSDAPNAFSKGFDGQITERNAMPLFNLAWYPAMFWDGRATDIESQIFHPVSAKNEMNLSWPEAEKRLQQSSFYVSGFAAVYGKKIAIDSVLITQTIGQFVRTLISNRSKYDSVLQGMAYFTTDELKGLELMNDQTKGDCLHCHTTDANALGTTARFSNNGLDNVSDANGYADKGLGGHTGKPEDVGLFKIPSLRNVAVTSPYMHDGRFETLGQVLDFYSDSVHYSVNVDPKMGTAPRGGAHLTELEKQQIIAFLHTLTDSAFISDPALANPFQ